MTKVQEISLQIIILREITLHSKVNKYTSCSLGSTIPAHLNTDQGYFVISVWQLCLVMVKQECCIAPHRYLHALHSSDTTMQVCSEGGGAAADSLVCIESCSQSQNSSVQPNTCSAVTENQTFII